jgi:DNA-binding NarL/FixJ family response regulator
MKRGGKTQAGTAVRGEVRARAPTAARTEQRRTGVLLAGMQAALGHELRALLQRHELELLGECGSANEALASSAIVRPDVVIMDLGGTEAGGVEILHRLARWVGSAHEEEPDRPVLVALFTARALSRIHDLRTRSTDHGARGVDARRELASSAEHDDVDGVSSGVCGVSLLSQREREVLQLLAEGLTSKEIGGRLHIALPTVETHRRQIMSKLRIRTIAALTKFAIREGLTRLEG